MLTKQQRFHGHNSLRQVYNKGASAYTRTLKMLLLDTNSNNSRVAVVVSKKVHKSAVIRNRIRRRIYSVVAKQLASKPNSADIIFIVNDASVANVAHAQLVQEIESLWAGIKPTKHIGQK